MREAEAGAGDESGQARGKMLLHEGAAARVHHPTMPVPIRREPHAGIPVGVDDRQATAGAEDARRFRQRSVDVVDVEVDLDGGDEVEHAAGKLEPRRVALPHAHATYEPFPRDAGPGGRQHLGTLVEAHDAPLGPDIAAELAGEEPRSASHVETPLARPW